MILMAIFALLHVFGSINCIYSNDTAIFHEIFDYLHKYNGMNIDHILIASTESYFQNEESTLHALLNTEFIKLKTVSFVFNKHHILRLAPGIVF